MSSSLITTYTSNTAYFYTPDNNIIPYPAAITPTSYVTGVPTGTKVNVTGTSTYLYSVNFYDDRGRVIQSHSTNYTGGKDTTTMQYSFSGQVLRTLTGHKKGGTNPQSYLLLTKMTYDAMGRLIQTNKKTGNSFEVTIAKNQYDELGQLKQKNIGLTRISLTNLAYSSTPLDSLKFDYNIRGWLRGINKDFTNALGGATNWFGMELNYDFGFSQSQLNGNIAGIKWRNNGDQEQRAYGFTYDAGNRLTKADFTQYTSSAWNITAGLDFSLKSMSYDANGNILSMVQKGIKLNSILTIDSLVYGYNTNSNQLNYVTDKINDVNSVIGDFKEVTNNTTQDYWYDGNGNMNKDLNKNISAITYNYLNLPQTITVTGKGTIAYLYDAAGSKLRKTTTDTTATPDKITITDYAGIFNYQNDTLQYIAQEEGRIRPKTQARSDTMYYDYFEKDHLGNTRVVLTDEKQQDTYPAATLENAAGINTQRLYYTINTADTISVNSIVSWNATTGKNYVNNNGNPPYNTDPNTNTTAISNFVYKLNGASGSKTGLGITLKVMTGDVVDIYGKSFWHSTGTNPSNNDLITSALSSFVSAFAGTGAVAAVKDATASALNVSTITTGGLNSWLTSIPNTALPAVPKAYINWILFDEQFKPVSGGSGYDLVSTSSDAVKSHARNVTIGKGGYLYVYCSNESNTTVYFDNLQLIHTKGPLLETTNYYPFGLTMAGISSKAAGKLENKKQYNGIEHTTELDLNQYDAFYRTLDPQIGRLWQIDPMVDILENYSPYESMGNNPISNVDPMGDFSTRFGAWLHKVFNGGGTVGQNSYGEWYVKKSVEGDDGSAGISLTYGKGRNATTAYREKLAAEYESYEREERLIKLGVWDPNLDADQAKRNLVGLGVGLALPNAILKPVTNAANSKVTNIVNDIPKTPVGRSGNPIAVVTKNIPRIISGRKFTGHALDQMQSRGVLSPSAVIDVIQNAAKSFPGNQPGTMVYIRDNLKVVTNTLGDVITVMLQ